MTSVDNESLNYILGSLAVALGAAGYFFYIRGIIQGKVKPHAFTWFVWGLLTAIAFVAQLSDGGGAGSWVTGFTALCSFGFAIIGLERSSRIYIEKTDWLFFVGSLAAIPLWYLTGDPLLSVIVITIIDALAFFPTFRKAFYHPQTENEWTYFLSGIKFLVALFALQNFSLVTALYPASLVIANGAFVLMVLLRRGNKKTKDIEN